MEVAFDCLIVFASSFDSVPQTDFLAVHVTDSWLEVPLSTMDHCLEEQRMVFD